MDILLIDPPYTSLKGMATNRGYHVGLTSLAAYLRYHSLDCAVLMGDLVSGLTPYDSALHMNVKAYAAGQSNYEIVLTDKNHPIWGKIATIINQAKPKAIGISYLTPLKGVVEKIVDIVKNLDSNIKVIAGSFHPSICPEEVMQNPNIDFAVVGEGEIPLYKLIVELKKDKPNLDNVPGIYYRNETGQLKCNPKADVIADLDDLPFLARDLVLNNDYDKYRVHSIYTTRGCPYTCSFCADRGLWLGKVRRRSVQHVMEELSLLKNTYKNIDYIDIIDGTFTFDKKYIESFCNAMITSKINLKWRCTARYDNLTENILHDMKLAGCSGLYLGAESGSEKILSNIDKRISTQDIIRVSQLVHKSGIISATAFLIGLPEEDKEDARQTLELMKKIKTDILDINSYVPLPGTTLYSCLSEEEKRNINWLKIGYKSYNNYFSKKLSQDEFNYYRDSAYKISNSVKRKTVFRLGLKLVGSKITRAFKNN